MGNVYYKDGFARFFALGAAPTVPELQYHTQPAGKSITLKVYEGTILYG